MIRSNSKLKIACFGIALALTSTLAHAAPARFMEMGKSVSAPLGHVQFCLDNSEACIGQPEQPVVVKLSENRWQELIDLNKRVNKKIRPVTDEEQFGVLEYWGYPTNGQGDCEEYVLEKQRELLKAGWPRSALLITVAKDMKNAGHAVLTVRTDQGDMILDNQIEAVLPWYATPYRYIKRQSTREPAKWTGISDTRVTAVGSVGN
ncbi:Predicted transglutaminase-like cysteine proteinase [Roseibium suaedae]|uniref:Predicted transglutaminase-like cysteine proteinase n=2 Tax=Roseibium suaedae TaxID=735517 RepID=A0A1M7G3M5_9HYPH|nr:Predicted transglutaminase-like cysteine proteinase [Roseibium suaedae]